MVLLNSSSCNLDWKPTNYKFTSLQGKEGTLYDSKGPNGLLVMFICNHCPYVKSIENKISSETKRIQKIGLKVLLLCQMTKISMKKIVTKILLIKYLEQTLNSHT